MAKIPVYCRECGYEHLGPGYAPARPELRHEGVPRRSYIDPRLMNPVQKSFTPEDDTIRDVGRYLEKTQPACVVEAWRKVPMAPPPPARCQDMNYPPPDPKTFCVDCPQYVPSAMPGPVLMSHSKPSAAQLVAMGIAVGALAYLAFSTASPPVSFALGVVLMIWLLMLGLAVRR